MPATQLRPAPSTKLQQCDLIDVLRLFYAGKYTADIAPTTLKLSGKFHFSNGPSCCIK